MSQWEQFKQEIAGDRDAINRAVKAARELTIRIKCRRAINDMKKSRASAPEAA